MQYVTAVLFLVEARIQARKEIARENALSVLVDVTTAIRVRIIPNASVDTTTMTMMDVRSYKITNLQT